MAQSQARPRPSRQPITVQRPPAHHLVPVEHQSAAISSSLRCTPSVVTSGHCNGLTTRLSRVQEWPGVCPWWKKKKTGSGANEAPCNIRQLFERSPASVSSSFAPHPTNHSHQIIRLFFTLQGQSTLALLFLLLLSFLDQDEVDSLCSAGQPPPLVHTGLESPIIPPSVVFLFVGIPATASFSRPCFGAEIHLFSLTHSLILFLSYSLLSSPPLASVPCSLHCAALPCLVHHIAFCPQQQESRQQCRQQCRDPRPA